MVRGPSSATWSAAASRTSSSPRDVLGQLGVGPDQRPAQRQLTGQQLHPGRLVEGGVVVAHAGPRQQLPHDLLVDGGVLPHVQPAEVEAEDLHRLAQAQQPVVGQRPRAVAAQRGVDDVEVGAQLVRATRTGGSSAWRSGPGTGRPSTVAAVAASRAAIPLSARR